MRDDTRTYGETGIVYKAAAAAPFHALKEISMQHRNKAIAVGGKNGSILRPGMGVFIELPVDSKLHVYVANAFGSITAVDNDSNNITCRLILDRENIPEYVLGGLGENELVQTNAVLQVPFKWVAGTFHLWPPSLFQAECTPQDTETSMGNEFLGRIYVCDMQFNDANLPRRGGC